MRRGWNRVQTKPNEQTFETAPYSAEILGVFVDTDQQQQELEAPKEHRGASAQVVRLTPKP